MDDENVQSRFSDRQCGRMADAVVPCLNNVSALQRRHVCILMVDMLHL